MWMCRRALGCARYSWVLSGWADPSLGSRDTSQPLRRGAFPRAAPGSALLSDPVLFCTVGCRRLCLSPGRAGSELCSVAGLEGERPARLTRGEADRDTYRRSAVPPGADKKAEAGAGAATEFQFRGGFGRGRGQPPQ
ncbi:hypothetical protein EK904_005948 [Melospiza melodia maxima]|nr:hypothetical protein EK904_005948 [Melospiza melodia maxima]